MTCRLLDTITATPSHALEQSAASWWCPLTPNTVRQCWNMPSHFLSAGTYLFWLLYLMSLVIKGEHLHRLCLMCNPIVKLCTYPVVERYYLLLQINATSGHLCRFDVWLKSLYIIILAINKLVSQIGKIPDKIICPLISTQLSSAIYLHDLLGSYLVVYSTFLNDHHNFISTFYNGIN
jgi:hypothetical protein